MKIARFLLFLLLPCTPLLASNIRSAVSVNGLDTNACTVASPCRSIAAAVLVTTPGGEIIAVDSAGYGTFNVPWALTISGAPGVEASITATSGDAVLVNPATSLDRVILRNLVIIGNGGFIGIHRTSSVLSLLGCVVRGFPGAGVLSVDMDDAFLADRCAFLDNAGGYGLHVDGKGPTLAAVTITNSEVQGNSIGLSFGDHTSAAVVNTIISGNSVIGIEANNSGSPTASDTKVVVDGCTIANNATGVFSTSGLAGDTATLALSGSVVSYNTTAATSSGTGVLTSFGNNRFSGNGANGSAFLSIAVR